VRRLSGTMGLQVRIGSMKAVDENAKRCENGQKRAHTNNKKSARPLARKRRLVKQKPINLLWSDLESFLQKLPLKMKTSWVKIKYCFCSTRGETRKKVCFCVFSTPGFGVKSSTLSSNSATRFENIQRQRHRALN